jgi:hypothetical protein
MKDTLNKTLERFVNGGDIGRKADNFLALYYKANPSNFKQALTLTIKEFGMSGLCGLVKQSDAELTDDQAYAVARDVVRRVTGNAMAPTWTGSSGGFEDMLAQIAQPKGGTENLTNVASPGAPPARIAAVPGESGNYPDKAKPIGAPSEGGYYDSRGRYSSTGHYLGYQQAPGAFVSGQGSHSVQTQDGAQQPYGRLQSATDNPRSRAHISQYDDATYLTTAKPGVVIPGRVAGQRYSKKSVEYGYSKSGMGKGQSKQVGAKSDYLSSGRAPNILQSIAFGEQVAPQARTNPDGSVVAAPKFSVVKDVWHLEPESKHYEGVEVTPQTLLKAQKFTRGILKAKRDVNTSLAGSREGAVVNPENESSKPAERRSRSFHTEEDYGDTGDASQYPADSTAPYSDNPEDTLASDVGMDFFMEEDIPPPMSGLTAYEESQKKADDDEALVQEKMACKCDEESEKCLRSGQYGLIDYFKQRAIAHRTIASNLRKRHY